MSERDAERGAQLRRQVVGGSYVDRTAREVDPFLAPFFELREAFLQLGGYAGYPAALEALRVLAEVRKESASG
jgi:hypothetical protein